MVPVISECGVNLSEIQIRMLKLQFFRTPSISLLFDNQLHDFHRRSGNAGNVLFVKNNVFVTSLYHFFIIPQE
ncbi:hypothetical protein BH24ACT21_BH24ACT21_14910 [soil metagenome]